MANLVEEDRQKRASEDDKPVADAPVVRPKGFRSKKKQEFIIRREERNLEPLFRVIGEKPERWIQQTDFNNDEAVGYLADRLAKLGVEDELFKSGARAGDAVVIGEDDNSVVFDWEPTMVGGAELLSSPRGTDTRLEEIIRPTRAQKREEYKERMDAKAEARAELEQERIAGVWTESVEYRKKLKEKRSTEGIDMPDAE
jgi:GTPase obg